jgi:hypothetical protein
MMLSADNSHRDNAASNVCSFKLKRNRTAQASAIDIVAHSLALLLDLDLTLLIGAIKS